MMRTTVNCVAVFACSLAFAIAGPIITAAQKKESAIPVTIQEPARYSLAELYEKADVVARLELISGDAEHYEYAVYKANIKETFKGAKNDNVLYVGPHIGLRLGWEYVLFLKKTEKLLEPRRKGETAYGPVRPAAVMNDGYGAMEVSYECGFGGKDVKNQCDYAVRVCTDYIQLPDNMPIFPPMSEDAPFGCRWVRKDSFLGALRGFTNTWP